MPFSIITDSKAGDNRCQSGLVFLYVSFGKFSYYGV